MRQDMDMDTPWKIALSDIDFGPEEEAAVAAVVRSKWLTMGEKTAEFERLFAAAVGARHAVAVNNCTAALHLALMASGVGPGDEVIVPSLTFVATANAALYCGAVPVFGDICGPDTLLLDPADVERKITPRTRAVVPVHYGGYCCDMDAFGRIATKYGVTIVEDAAHAPGSRWHGRMVGALSHLTCFSFFSNKNLSTGEGGMITTDDDRLAAEVRRNRSHGMTTVTLDRHKGHAFSYDVVSAGYNYRPTEMQSALGVVQLGKLERNNAVRRSLVRRYHERLRTCADLTIPFMSGVDDSSCHIFVVVLGEGVDREQVQRGLKAAGIQTSIHYPPVHRFSNFAQRFSADVPRLDAVSARVLTLPLHPLMREADVDEVCERLSASLAAMRLSAAEPGR
jgi:dTDP-4-amino-4,6-dideoxygalactose transaminase